jgi:molecular chaperone GrpE (heat shock protein)
MESLSRIVNNLPDAASAAEEERQKIGAQLRTLRNDSLLTERSRSASVEHFLKASEEVEANLERLQEALSRASSEDDEFFREVVHRVDSATAMAAHNPMLPATPQTTTPAGRPFFGGDGGNKAEESEEQKKLFEEMRAQETTTTPTSDEGSGVAASNEVVKLRKANAALSSRVEELTEGLARAEERADWAVNKSETQKEQLVEVSLFF